MYKIFSSQRPVDLLVPGLLSIVFMKTGLNLNLGRVKAQEYENINSILVHTFDLTCPLCQIKKN